MQTEATPPPQPRASEPAIRATGIVKTFPGVRALRGVDLEVLPGEVHALVGENGAGKSTLMNVLSGVLKPDEGVITLGGRDHASLDPAQAQSLGVGFVHQEPAALTDLSVMENMTLGSESRRLRMFETGDQDARALEELRRVGLEIGPDMPVGRLSIAQRHLLDVAKTLHHEPRVLIMDEPTATLTPTDAERLFGIVRDHVAGGGSVIYISHRLEEIFAIADRVTVLRDGAVVGTLGLADSGIDQDGLIAMMVGRRIEALFPDREPPAGTGAVTSLVVRGLLADVRPEDPDLEVRPGEILGIAGLIGSGRTELVEALFGVNPALDLQVEIDGRPVALDSPGAAAAAGIALVPEDRRGQGLVGVMTVGENLTLTVPDRIASRGWISRRRQRELARDLVERLEIRTFGPGQVVGTLSGGNQQKVVIAKWMARDSRVFIFDEPTKGVDVGARSEIYRQIVDLADRGRIVIVVSSELIEILGLSDRVLVMRQGAPAALLETARTDEEEIMRAAFGRAA